MCCSLTKVLVVRFNEKEMLKYSRIQIHAVVIARPLGTELLLLPNWKIVFTMKGRMFQRSWLVNACYPLQVFVPPRWFCKNSAAGRWHFRFPCKYLRYLKDCIHEVAHGVLEWHTTTHRKVTLPLEPAAEIQHDRFQRCKQEITKITSFYTSLSETYVIVKSLYIFSRKTETDAQGQKQRWFRKKQWNDLDSVDGMWMCAFCIGLCLTLWQRRTLHDKKDKTHWES